MPPTGQYDRTKAKRRGRPPGPGRKAKPTAELVSMRKMVADTIELLVETAKLEGAKEVLDRMKAEDADRRKRLGGFTI